MFEYLMYNIYFSRQMQSSLYEISWIDILLEAKFEDRTILDYMSAFFSKSDSTFGDSNKKCKY